MTLQVSRCGSCYDFRFVGNSYLGITSRFPVIREKSRKGQKTRPFYHLIIYMKQPPETVGTRAGAAICPVHRESLS